jgi:exodeoxyribonuclease-3
MRRLMEVGLLDIHRILHPEERKYTCWSHRRDRRDANKGVRLDYFLVDERLKEKVSESIIQDQYFGSDHCPVEIVLETK